MAKIYTKYGDSGYTYTKQNPKTPKNHILVHILGDLDELNSNLGYLHSLVQKLQEKETGKKFVTQNKIDFYNGVLFFLKTNIETLFSVGAFVGYDTKLSTDVLEESIRSIENFIDEQEKENGALSNFVLPIGAEASTYAHICRSVCRRAERNFYDLSDKQESVDTFLKITVYLNRLSDSLFSISRSLNRIVGFQEILWISRND